MMNDIGLDVDCLIDPTITKGTKNYSFKSYGKNFLKFVLSHAIFRHDFISFLRKRLITQYKIYL